MLIRFTFENFTSFKKTTTLELEAASIRELPENTFTINDVSTPFRLLKSTAIYGANASGKSNILNAFLFFRNFLLSPLAIANKPLLEPYKLDAEYEKRPSLFEIEILIENYKYRYGFALTEKSIFSEWLFATEKRKEELLFKRDGQNFQIEKGFRHEAEGNVQMLSRIIKDDVLFISHLNQFKSQTSEKIVNWFQKSILIRDSSDRQLLNYTAGLLNIPYYNRRVTSIVNKADLSFSSVEAEIKEKAVKTGYEEGFIAALYDTEFKNYRIKTRHPKYTNEKLTGYIDFDLLENESLGSQKFVLLLGPILKTLKEGGLIWIDELDARLHSNLLLFILRFFNSNINNPLGSQLIYTAHNSVPLKRDLRRDQMIFVKRDKYNGSLLTSLHQWDSKIRSDASFDKDYLEGRYGAVPKIVDLTPDLFD